MAEKESISREDMNLIYMTDSVTEMRQHLLQCAVRKFGLVKKPLHSRWWLGERNKGYRPS
jgi:hypothetical protein